MDDSTKRDVGMSIISDPDTTRIEQPHAEGAKESVQLPLRLLLVGELEPQAARPDWSASSRLLSADKSSFPGIMARLAPRLALEVQNKISDAPRLVDVELSFTKLDDFHPERVAAQMPALAHLLEVRRLVDDLQRGELDLKAFRERVEKVGIDRAWGERLFEALSKENRPSGRTGAPPSAARDEGDPVDRLLGMVDLGGDSQEAAADGADQKRTGADPQAESTGGAGRGVDGRERSDAADRPPDEPAENSGGGFMGALVRAVSGASEPSSRVEKSAADLFLSDLDEVISEQINEVINHPSFRRLEAAWRGLKMLVDRFDFRKGVELDVLSAGKEDLSEALYYQVLLPEHSDDPERPPLSAIILGYDFGREPTDVALLEDLAETGASLQVPLIGSVDASFFGVAEPAGMNRLPSLRQHLKGPEYIAWNDLRDRADARHLALVAPPVLLREPYGADRAAAFSFEERGCLWGGGALLVAVAAAGSFVRTGWPTHLLGNGENRIDNLPVWKSPRGMIPLAAALPETKQAELADAGFVVLGCHPNRDSAHIAHAATVRRAGSYDSAETAEEMRSHASLPSQLFVARAAQFLLAYQNDVKPGSDVEHVQTELSSRLRLLLRISGHDAPADAVHIEHISQDQLPEHDVFQVTLRPPTSVLNEPVNLVMQLMVSK